MRATQTEIKKTSKKHPSAMLAFLQQELDRRLEMNPRYSLRAFASYLEIDASYLSKILTGKRDINSTLLSALGKKIGLSKQEIEHLQLARIADIHPVAPLLKEQKKFNQLSAAQLEIITDLNHYAILELMKLNDFKSDPSWIADKLSIKVAAAREYIARLQKLDLLKIDANGVWHDQSGGFNTHVIHNNFTSFAHKLSQKKVIQGALEAMEKVPIENRDQSSMMMATSYEKIAEAKERIKLFRRELCAFLEDTHEKDAVFQLSTSLYPITTKSVQKNRKE